MKIGFSENVERRHKQLESHYRTSLVILHVVDGDRRREKEIHDQFHHLRYHKTEQFRPTAELRDFIGKPLVVSDDPDTLELMGWWNGPMKFKIRGQPFGNTLVANLTRLGHAPIMPVVYCSKVAKTIFQNTGVKVSRQRISAMTKAVHLQPDTIAWLAKGLGVKPEELTRPADPPPSPRPRGRRGG